MEREVKKEEEKATKLMVMTEDILVRGRERSSPLWHWGTYDYEDQMGGPPYKRDGSEVVRGPTKTITVGAKRGRWRGSDGWPPS